MFDEKPTPKTRRTGSITKIDERRWLVQIFLGRDQDGKQMRHKKTVHGTKKDAQIYLNGVLRDKDLGRFTEPARITLNAYLDQWLQTSARQKLSLRTFQDYEEMLRRYVRDGLGRWSLEKLQPMHIQDLYTKLLQDRGLAAPTVRKLHAVLSSALKQAAALA